MAFICTWLVLHATKNEKEFGNFLYALLRLLVKSHVLQSELETNALLIVNRSEEIHVLMANQSILYACICMLSYDGKHRTFL